jgi:hypothetical protein
LLIKKSRDGGDYVAYDGPLARRRKDQAGRGKQEAGREGELRIKN